MNAVRYLELFLTGVAGAAGILMWFYRYRLASYILAEDSKEVCGWRKAVPVSFLLVGQLLLIWAIIYGLRQFGVDVEPAQP